MLWARGRFEQDRVQLNKFNKLKIEVFSKLSSSIKVESIELITNVQTLNKKIDLMTEGQPMKLTKLNQIQSEVEFYV